MMNKVERKFRKHFQNEDDWKSYQRARKTRNKREQRDREKQKAQISQAIQQKFEQVFLKCKNFVFSSNKSIFRRYREGIYRGIGNIDYNQFITLTCKHTTNLNALINATRRFVKSLYNSGIIGNYFFVFEHEGDNYHVHLLVDCLNDDLLNSEVSNWKLGNTKVVEINDKQSKIDHIFYMTKMLNPLKRDTITQRLIDSWEIFYAPTKAVKLTEANKSINNFQVFLERLKSALCGIFNINVLNFLKPYSYAVDIN